jgi:hypothetical protein
VALIEIMLFHKMPKSTKILLFICININTCNLEEEEKSISFEYVFGTNQTSNP